MCLNDVFMKQNEINHWPISFIYFQEVSRKINGRDYLPFVEAKYSSNGLVN